MISAAPVQGGDVIAGKYRIERVLGAGGMGVVVAATHIYLGERVAIKFLLPEALKGANVGARFLREAKVAARLRSEHAARVHDVGTLGNGAPYLVMEYLEGSDLAAVVKSRGPLSPGAAVELILQACEALADAHSIGIIHRDIKPANLFVTTRRDGTPAVKVIDFGISKITKGVDAGVGITKTAEMRGSLLFIPPEQMASPRDVDPRSDLWALGVTLYHLVTGTYPFVGETALEICAKILRNEPTPPRLIRPDLPEELETVILRCLRKPLSARYADIAELAAALSQLAPVHARASVDRISRVLSLPSITVDAPPSSSAPTTGGAAQESPATEGAATQRPRDSSATSADGAAASEKQKLRAHTQTVKSSWGSTSPPEGRADTWRRAKGVTLGFVVGLVTAFAMVVGLDALSRGDAHEAADSPGGSGSVEGAGALKSTAEQATPVTLETPAPSAAIPARAPTTSASASKPKPPPATVTAATGTPAAWAAPAVIKMAAPRKTSSIPSPASSERRPEPF